MALELLLRSEHEILLLDEPDNFLDVPGKGVALGSTAGHAEVGPLREPRS